MKGGGADFYGNPNMGGPGDFGKGGGFGGPQYGMY